MFEITIKGTLIEIAQQVSDLSKVLDYQDSKPSPELTTKPTRKTKASTPAPQPEAEEEEVVDIDGDGSDDDLLAPADPMPDTGKGLVDGGTGKPIPKSDGAVKTMTFDDVKVAAAKLVAKNQARLAEILLKYKAANLSAVPKEQLGDFAADVMEALG